MPTEASQEGDDTPLFDVIVSKPSTLSVEALRARAESLEGKLGQVPEIETLIRALKSSPTVRTHAALTSQQVNSFLLRKSYESLGLSMETRPVLKLSRMVAKAEDGRVACPACDVRVLLTEDRRCPACLVFVDKVDPAVAMRRRIREQEQKRLESQIDFAERKREREDREALEESIRAQIRAELEEQYGLQSPPVWWKTRRGVARGSAVLLLVGSAAFGAGRLTLTDRSATDTRLQATRKQGPDQALTPAAVATLIAISQGKAVPEGQFARDASELGSLQELDVADSLVRETTTPSTFLSHREAPVVEGPLAEGGSSQITSYANGNGAPNASQLAKPTMPAAVGAGLTSRDRALLTSQLAIDLAEMGEFARASEVITTLQASHLIGDDAKVNGAVKSASILVRAHTLRTEGSESREKSVGALRARLGEIDDPVLRIATETRVGAIVSRLGPDMAEVGLGFLTQAAASLRSLPAPEVKAAATSAWVVAAGDMVLTELQDQARAGHWSRAYALEAQLDALVTQANSNLCAVSMLAQQREARKVLGSLRPERDTAELAMQRLVAEPGPERRADGLRDWLSRTDSFDQAAVKSAITSTLAMPDTPPQAQAAVLSNLALAYARSGRLDAYTTLLARLTEADGLSPEEREQRALQLRLAGELALANYSHKRGAYDEAEQHLQRVARAVLKPLPA